MQTPPRTYVRAQALRRTLTRDELALWLLLKGRQLAGQKFRCQHPIGPYILDFYCGRARLALELDGCSHASEEAAAYDRRRDRWLEAQGIETLRIPLGAIRADWERVRAVIEAAVLRRIAEPTRQASPGRR